MEKDYEYILKTKTKIDEAFWSSEKKNIVREAVKKLKSEGKSKAQIQELFKIEAIKEQDNSMMVNNNSRYLDLLNDVLSEE